VELKYRYESAVEQVMRERGCVCGAGWLSSVYGFRASAPLSDAVNGTRKDAMNNPDVEHPIQSQPDIGEPPARADGLAESLSVQDVMQRHEQRQRTVPAGTLFGALVGLFMGAVVGAACCWLTGRFPFFYQAVLIGALGGPIVGALIGLKERKTRGGLARPDIATFICVVYALLPSLLLVLQGVSGVRGRFSGYLLVGAVFAGPMIGLLVGGILDRAFEEYQKKSWGVALPFAVIGVAICIGLVCLFDAIAYGPDPKEVGRNVRTLLLSEWNKTPHVRDAGIDNVTLVRKDRTQYSGFADVTFAGRTERLLLEVVVEGEMLEVSWTNEPVGEPGR
jgi:MFS family permease